MGFWIEGKRDRSSLHNMMICWYDHHESGGSHSGNMHCHKITSSIAGCWETRFSLLCFLDHCFLDTWLDSAYFRQPPMHSLSDVFLCIFYGQIWKLWQRNKSAVLRFQRDKFKHSELHDELDRILADMESLEIYIYHYLMVCKCINSIHFLNSGGRGYRETPYS